MKKKKIKARNHVAIAAFQRNGSGVHRNKKKEASKNACRTKKHDND